MSWRALTEADLKSRLSAAELAAFRSKATVDGTDSDPVGAVLTQVTDLVRGYIAGCPNNQLGADGTIPTKLVGDAIAICVIEVMARAGGAVLDLGDVRKNNADRAMRTLKDVARGLFKIDAPTTFTAETTSFIKPSFTTHCPQFSWDQQSGI